MTRRNHLAAAVCLLAALVAQLVVPAGHTLVHYLEDHPAAVAGPVWVVTSAAARNDAPRPAHHHGGSTHHHVAGSSHHHAPPDAPHHHHDGDRPGERHGAHALEHLAQLFYQPPPPVLPRPAELVAPVVVPLRDGRLVAASVARAHLVRGPPRGAEAAERCRVAPATA